MVGVGPTKNPKELLLHRFKKLIKKIICGERGSNTRPSDLQSDALPTELSPLCAKALNSKYLSINYISFQRNRRLKPTVNPDLSKHKYNVPFPI